MAKFLQLKPVRWIAILLAIAGLYALLGFQLAPRIVRSQAIAFVKSEYGRDLAIGLVKVNPFLLQLEVHDLALPDADGKPMLGFRRLFVDFEASSLWHRAYVFKDLDVETPELRAVVRPDGSFNLSDLAAKEPSAPEPQSSGLPAVWLQSLVVSNGSLAYSDLARSKPLERSFTPVTFSLKDFHTTSEGGGFALAATSESGEGFDWKGRFGVTPTLSSQGEFRIRGLKATNIDEFLDNALPFALESGVIELGGSYDVAMGDGLEAKVILPQINVTGMGLRARGADANWVELPAIEVADTNVALPDRRVVIGGITVTGMQVQAWMSPDGSVNLTQLFAPTSAGSTANIPEAAVAGTAAADTNTAVATADTSTAAAPASASLDSAAQPAAGPNAAATEPPPWTVEVTTVQVAKAVIKFDDRRSEPVKHFIVSPLDVTVSGASTELAKPVAVTVAAVIDGVAPFKAAGSVTPEPLAAELDIALTGARMFILQPYVLPVADLTIKDGTLTVEGKVHLDPPDAPGPELRFDGDVTIEEFASIDNTLKQDFVNFQRVELRKLSYAMGPDAVSIDQVLVQKPFARFVINPDRVINISAVLDPEGTRAALEARRAEAAAEAALTPAQRRERDRARDAAQDQADKEREARGPMAEPALAPLPEETTPVRIRQVRIEGGTLDFADNFIKPNFAARIEQLSGTMTGLSSDPASHAQLDFKGRLDQFSPVTISGEVQPFSFERYTNVDLRFENISLPIFNPYSGQIAGYSIAKGKLTTDLHYQVANRKLDAKHHIVIDQLEWGESTAAQGEATLPVKFATVLLRDKDGVIDLDIPVTGTLDDPSFRIGPIVWQVIRNLIVKAVTAPFALLGALFSGAEEAQHVDFAAGSAVLEPGTVERLGALAKSLVEKPGLSVDVPIGPLPAIDGPALQNLAYDSALAGVMEEALPAPSGKSGTRPPFDELSDKNKVLVLTALIRKQTGTEPAIPEPPKPPEGTSRTDAKAMQQAATVEFLQKEARSHVSVDTSEYDQLAEQRATAVEQALLEGSGLEPSRVFTVRDGKVSAQDGKVQLELELK